METKVTIKDGAGLPSASALPAPSPVCFFSRIPDVDLSLAVCANFYYKTLTAQQPFEHCEFCQCWNGERF